MKHLLDMSSKSVPSQSYCSCGVAALRLSKCGGQCVLNQEFKTHEVHKDYDDVLMFRTSRATGHEEHASLTPSTPAQACPITGGRKTRTKTIGGGVHAHTWRQLMLRLKSGREKETTARMKTESERATRLLANRFNLSAQLALQRPSST